MARFVTIGCRHDLYSPAGCIFLSKSASRVAIFLLFPSWAVLGRVSFSNIFLNPRRLICTIWLHRIFNVWNSVTKNQVPFVVLTIGALFNHKSSWSKSIKNRCVCFVKCCFCGEKCFFWWSTQKSTIPQHIRQKMSNRGWPETPPRGVRHNA